MQLHLVRFVSESRLSKPETTVFAEVYGIREAHDHEVIHLHDIGSTSCKVCGKQGFMLWTEREDRFAQHPNRCGDLPPVVVSLT
jgi:hypothetical protein